MSRRWQLLDRPVEQEAIRWALTGGESRGAILFGAAGVGKTTLARTVTTSMRCKLNWAACTESSRGIPLGAFAQWVRPSASRDPVALIASARECIVTQGNTIVGIDDAHLLDQLSATLLHQIAVEGAGRIVATVRNGEQAPDAITSLWKDGYLQRLELQPFTKKQSIALVESVLGGTLEGLSADVMWESSGGNPLFLRHMVEGALDAETLTEVNGVWQLRGPTVVPSGLAALLEDRLDHAGSEIMNALKLLALCEPLDIETLSELAGEEAVDGAEMHGLVRIVRDGPHLVNVRFSHPLFGDVVRRRIGTASARKLRGRLVEVLRDRNLDSAASRIRLAQLCVDSNQAVETELLVAASKDAMFLSNLPLGERIARAAFERSGGVREAELLSRALLWQGYPAQADEILDQFEPDDLNELQLVQWGVPRLSILFWAMGEVAHANQILTLLRQRVQHPSLKLAVEATGSAMAVHENRIAEGIAEAERVLTDPNTPKQVVDWAAFAAGLAMPVAGRGADFEPIAAKCRAEQHATEGMIRVMVRYCDVLALTSIGELDLADRRAADYAEFSSAGQRMAWAIAKITFGLVAVYRGNFPDAISALEQAIAAPSTEVSMPWRLPARVLLAKAYAALGRPEESERVFADAEEHRGPHLAIHSPQMMVARSWHAAAKGLERRAVELARAAADVAHRAGQYAVEAEALHHAARFGDRTVAQRVAALAETVQGRMVTLQAQHAAAVAAGDAAALDAVSTEFEVAGLLLSAADSAAQAAPLHDRAGQRRNSAESAARALRLAAQCGGATTPAIRSAGRPLPVTSREREIAAFVAEGLTNREIAERLTVSVRTVEGHIYRACIKLDVTDRDELAKIVWRDVKQ
ncbi:helix-turn-helix transcriptional regulator [Mycobacterium colombiense]|uniref:Helix-turn-helix transcriptional regulator n=1 Tax=Mycobacterium colombiense TaxID=339268 RepID=A0A1A2ZB29_9MYCO|nr:LuxR C-terminal-related transcriptional regulator [Mycobacterium colombiense]OBI46868.1 helix-turn-helix transcriptional regulator [Mycobacterium colombiense]